MSPYWLGYGERYTFPTLGHRIKPLPVWGREKKKSSGKTDVTDEAQVAHLVEETVRRHGRLDAMFNNAGGPAPVGSIANIDMADYQKAMDVLVTSVTMCMKHAAPVMTSQGYCFPISTTSHPEATSNGLITSSPSSR